MLDWSAAAWEAAGQALPSPAQALAALRAAFGGDSRCCGIGGQAGTEGQPILLLTKHLDLSGIQVGGWGSRDMHK